MQFMHANVGWTVVLLGSFCFSQIFLEGGYECRLKYYVNSVPHIVLGGVLRGTTAQKSFLPKDFASQTLLKLTI